MGSPGVFIHSGTLGGRFSEVSPAAADLLPASPLATAPPINAPPRRRNFRRDVTGRRSSAMLVGSVIGRPPLIFNRQEIAQSRLKVIEEVVASYLSNAYPTVLTKPDAACPRLLLTGWCCWCTKPLSSELGDPAAAQPVAANAP